MRDSNLTFRIENNLSSAEKKIGELPTPAQNKESKKDDKVKEEASPYTVRVLANQFGFLSRRQ